MALYQRRESSGRTRFLLALSLSTVTALAVAAPLAIKAVNVDESTFAANTPAAQNGSPLNNDDLLSGSTTRRSLEASNADAKGGIESREPAKAQAQTSKSDDQPAATAPTGPEDSVLTNPTTTETPPDPSTTTSSPAATSTTVDPSTSSTSVTTTPTSSSTSTTDGSSTSSTTSTTQATTSTSQSTTTASIISVP